jgi:putative acetyltransferase
MMGAMTAPSPTIRPEQPADLETVRAINRAAFAGDIEADLVSRLWVDGDALFGLVAETDGQAVGHILFSRLPIILASGELLDGAALAPLAVLPGYQRHGIGSTLAQHGLAICQERGLSTVVVLGDPAYYTRFGFSVARAAGLETPWSGPFLMAIELRPECLGDGRGRALYPSAFLDLPEGT